MKGNTEILIMFNYKYPFCAYYIYIPVKFHMNLQLNKIYNSYSIDSALTAKIKIIK